MHLDLSKREFEVVGEATRGFSFKEIASRLFISKHTVETHIKKARKKNGAKNIADLTRMFVLDLEDAKQFYKTTAAILFLAIQLFIISDDMNLDLRKPINFKPKTTKVVRRNINKIRID